MDANLLQGFAPIADFRPFFHIIFSAGSGDEKARFSGRFREGSPKPESRAPWTKMFRWI
jgi:hypothetical protein